MGHVDLLGAERCCGGQQLRLVGTIVLHKLKATQYYTERGGLARSLGRSFSWHPRPTVTAVAI